jgi:hypothetical protein
MPEADDATSGAVDRRCAREAGRKMMDEQSAQQPGSDPQYSPDGRFWWDGQRWQPMPSAPSPRRRPPFRWVVLAILAVLIVGTVAAVAYSKVANPQHTITGTMTLFDASGYASGAEGCAGKDGYQDIQAGAQVTVSDESGKLLATSQLGRGDDNRPYCVFAFKVDGVPTAKVYQVEVAHRGKVAYSASDLAAAGWKADLRLGS